MLLLSSDDTALDTSSSTTRTPIVLELYQSIESDDADDVSRAVLAPASAASTQVLSYHNVSALNSVFGLWSLALSTSLGSSNMLSEMLMKGVVMDKVCCSNTCSGNVSAAPPCFVVDVDLSMDLSIICPTLRASIEMIVNGMKDICEEEELEDGVVVENNNLKENYTSLVSLEEHVFGDVGDSALIKAANNNGRGYQYISLVLAVQPSKKLRSSYQEEQALALTMYHLYKFSLSVNCVLALVDKRRAPESDSSNSNVTSNINTAATGSSQEIEISAMDVSALRDVVFQLSSGVSPRKVKLFNMKDTVIVGEEEVASSDSPQQQPSSQSTSLITPGTIDSLLIRNTMLKNASCEGQWDAAVDPLDKALPATVSMKESISEKAVVDAFDGYNDDEWLSKLASSMKVIEAPVVSKDESKTKSIKKEAKKDVAVSSFFENLLKK